MGWKQLLAYITGSVDQELLLRHEYLVTENRLLLQQIPGCVRLCDENGLHAAMCLGLLEYAGTIAVPQAADSEMVQHVREWHTPCG
jgi:hypothetical protein